MSLAVNDFQQLIWVGSTSVGILFIGREISSVFFSVSDLLITSLDQEPHHSFHSSQIPREFIVTYCVNMDEIQDGRRAIRMPVLYIDALWAFHENRFVWYVFGWTTVVLENWLQVKFRCQFSLTTLSLSANSSHHNIVQNVMMTTLDRKLRE